MNWPVITLGEVARWGSGGTPKRSEAKYFGDEVPWLSISDLNDGEVTEAKESLTHLGLENSSAKVVPPGTLLVAMYGSIGKLGIAGRELCTSQAIAFAQPNPLVIDTRYLFHFLLAERTNLQRLGRGGTQMNIGQADLKSWPIPLPPLPEQRRIAAILDQADELRAKRRETLTRLDSLAQSIFLDMFGDPRQNPNEWPMRPFAEVCPTHLGKMLDAKQQTGKYLRPYVRNINIQWLSLDLSSVAEMDFPPDTRNKYRLMDGDLLICEGGEPGRAAIWHGDIEECYFQKAVHRGRPVQDVATAEYLVMLLWFFSKRGLLADHITSATIAHLTGEKLKRMLIPVPPFAIQKHFSQLLSAIQDKSAQQNSSASELDSLFASLQDRSFRGEL